jgi:PhnB protein
MQEKPMFWFDNVEFRAHPWPGLIWVTAMLNVPDVPKARDLYSEVFGFVPIFEAPNPDNLAELIMTRMRYRGANFVITEEGFDYEGLAPASSGTASPFSFYVYVDDVDATYTQALKSGMTSVMEPQDTYWGDKRSRLRCPFGYVWDIAQRVAGTD